MKKTLLLFIMLTFSTLGTAFGQEFWERIYTLPDSCNRTYDIATNAQGDIFVATDKGLYKSSDYAETWESVWQEGIRYCSTLDIAPNGRICVGADYLWFSDDNGVSWESVDMYNPGSFDMYYRVKYFGNDTLFALPRCLGHGAYVEYSFDGGDTWNHQSIGNWNLDYSTDITMTQDRVFYVCLAYFGDKKESGRPAKGGVFKSRDCENWEAVELGLGNNVPSFFVVSYSKVLNGVILGDVNNMWKTPMTDEVLFMPIYGCAFLDDNKVIACGAKTHISFDGGQSFVSIDDAKGGSRIIAGRDGYLYSVFYGYTLPGARLMKSINPIDDLFKVKEHPSHEEINVFPNPTNGLVRIEGATVSEVQVYNTMGQLVKTVGDTNEIDMAHLPEGVYFLRITAKDGQQRVGKVAVSK